MFTTVSIGIVFGATEYDQPEDLLRDADIAMYRAKSLGKARYEVFSTEMRDRAVTRLQLETELRRAIEHEEFRIHYQPIVSLETGKVVGFEALLRWQHPDRGLVYPAEFISIAEEIGLSIRIDQWVLLEACRQTQQWQRRFPPNLRENLPLSINVNLGAPSSGNLSCCLTSTKFYRRLIWIHPVCIWRSRKTSLCRMRKLQLPCSGN